MSERWPSGTLNYGAYVGKSSLSLARILNLIPTPSPIIFFTVFSLLRSVKVGYWKQRNMNSYSGPSNSLATI